MFYCPTLQNSQDFQFQLRFFKKTANLHISRSISQKLNGKLNVLVNVFMPIPQI